MRIPVLADMSVLLNCNDSHLHFKYCHLFNAATSLDATSNVSMYAYCQSHVQVRAHFVWSRIKPRRCGHCGVVKPMDLPTS